MNESKGEEAQGGLGAWTPDDWHAWRRMSQGSPCGRHVPADGASERSMHESRIRTRHYMGAMGGQGERGKAHK
jgi:hypothetical protein